MGSIVDGDASDLSLGAIAPGILDIAVLSHLSPSQLDSLLLTPSSIDGLAFISFRTIGLQPGDSTVL